MEPAADKPVDQTSKKPSRKVIIISVIVILNVLAAIIAGAILLAKRSASTLPGPQIESSPLAPSPTASPTQVNPFAPTSTPTVANPFDTPTPTYQNPFEL